MSVGSLQFCPVLPHPLVLPTQIYTIYLEEELSGIGLLETKDFLGLSYHVDKMKEAMVFVGSWKEDDNAWGMLEDVFEKCRLRGMTML